MKTYCGYSLEVPQCFRGEEKYLLFGRKNPASSGAKFAVSVCLKDTILFDMVNMPTMLSLYIPEGKKLQLNHPPPHPSFPLYPCLGLRDLFSSPDPH